MLLRCRAGHRVQASITLVLDVSDNDAVVAVERGAARNVDVYCSRNLECKAGLDPDVERRATALATSLPSSLDPEIIIRACSICGCTEYGACDGGCTWVTLDRCSTCAPAIVPMVKPCSICLTTPHDRYCPRAAAYTV